MGTRINTPPLRMEILRLDSESKIPHNALEDAKALCLKHNELVHESVVYVPTNVIKKAIYILTNVIKKAIYILNDNDPNRTNIIRILQSEFGSKQTEHLTEKTTT